MARGVILETPESNIFLSPLLFKIEGPQAWDVAKGQQENKKKKKKKKYRNTEHAKNKGNTSL